MAAGIPLLLALTAVFATFGLIALPSAIFPVAMQAPALVLLIGLAVGVDYSMFYLKREREERAAGRSEQAALEAAAATSGRSVLISGLTVIVAMAGMFLTGDQIFASLGVAAITVVAIAMLGSLTVLPALLSKLGDRVDRARVPLVGRLRQTQRRRPDLGRDRRPRAAAAARVDRRRGRVAARPRRAGAPAPHGDAGARHVPAVAPRRAGVHQDAAGVPGDGVARQRRRPGAERERADRPGGDPAARAAGARQRPHARADHGRRQRDATVANVSIPIDGKTTDREAVAALSVLRDEIVPEHGRRAAGRRGRRHRARGAVAGRLRRDEVEPAAGRRVRAALRVRADAGRVPLDRRGGQGDRAQPALRRRGVRRAGDRLPARRRQGAARLHLHLGDRAGGAAPAVRDPVRPLDGLPRPRPRPDQGAVRQGREHGRRDLARDQAHRRRRDQRGDRDGLRVLDLRHALDAVLQAVRRRARRGDPDRRHHRPRRAPAGDDEAARRVELVPARGGSSGCRGSRPASRRPRRTRPRRPPPRRRSSPRPPAPTSVGPGAFSMRAPTRGGHGIVGGCERESGLPTTSRRRPPPSVGTSTRPGKDHHETPHDTSLDPRPHRRARPHRADDRGTRVPPVRARRPGLRPEGGAGRRPRPRAVYVRHRGRRLRRRLRHARRVREPGRPAVAADRAARDPHPGALAAPEGAGVPPRGRTRHHEHAVLEGEPLRRRPRRRARRLPRRRRLRPARLPRGRLGHEALDRLPRREVLPRVRGRLPCLRGEAHRGGLRPHPLRPRAAGRRHGGRAQGARLRPDRPPERERGDAHGPDLRLALPEAHPPVGDDRREPARALPLGPEDDRRAARPLRGPLREGRELSHADRRPRRLDAADGREHARPLALPADRGERRSRSSRSTGSWRRRRRWRR